MVNKKINVKTKRIDGYLHRIVEVLGPDGKVIDHVIQPLMVEFRPRDLLQVIVGASILAIPVAFTEETWKLGEELPLLNVLILSFISILFISLFVYLNFYRYMFKDNIFEFVKRVVSIYIFSLIVVGIILTLIDKANWGSHFLLSIKRVLIVAFPASMSAAISDNIK